MVNEKTGEKDTTKVDLATVPIVEEPDLIPSKIIFNVDEDKDGKIDGFQFNFKPTLFYTAEPVGSIKDLIITIDGKKIDPKKVTLIVRGQRIGLTNAPTFHEIWMPIYEEISVFVDEPGGLEAGIHELECILHQTTTSVYGGDLKDAEGRPYKERYAKTIMTVT